MMAPGDEEEKLKNAPHNVKIAHEALKAVLSTRYDEGRLISDLEVNEFANIVPLVASGILTTTFSSLVDEESEEAAKEWLKKWVDHFNMVMRELIKSPVQLKIKD